MIRVRTLQQLQTLKTPPHKARLTAEEITITYSLHFTCKKLLSQDTPTIMYFHLEISDVKVVTPVSSIPEV
jgi:hypothetical protein